MLNVSNLKLSKSKKIILSNVNLSVELGEIICFLGKNGAGKTTLLKSIVGVYKLDEGHSFFEDIDLASKNRSQIIHEIGIMIFNDAFYDFLTGRDNIEIVRNFYKNPFFSTDEIIDLFELKSVANEVVNKYSAGYKQRLLLALSVINCPKLVVWDEPFNSIDKNYIKSVINIIKHFQKSWNTTFLITSHSLEGVESIFSRVVLLKETCISLDIQVENLNNYYLFTIQEHIPIDKISYGNLYFTIDFENKIKIISNLDIKEFCFKNNLSEKIITFSRLTTKDIYEFI
ncbi:ATP-binding cassette domain-containing protein [Aquirufa sp. OSTEICH-129A]